MDTLKLSKGFSFQATLNRKSLQLISGKE